MVRIDFNEDIENCLHVLYGGGIILYPTDTVWGIGCDATNANAVNRIIELKKRPQNKSFVVLVASEKEILQYVASPDISVFDYLHTATKPTTVVYKHSLGLAENVLANDDSVAIRICNDEFCRHLIKRFRKPIVSTSANESGQKTPEIFSEIAEAIKNNIDYVVKHRQNENTMATPSSVIKWENGKVTVLRE